MKEKHKRIVNNNKKTSVSDSGLIIQNKNNKKSCASDAKM